MCFFIGKMRAILCAAHTHIGGGVGWSERILNSIRIYEL